MKSTTKRSLQGVLLVCVGVCCSGGSALAEDDWIDYAPLFATESAQPLKLAECKFL